MTSAQPDGSKTVAPLPPDGEPVHLLLARPAYERLAERVAATAAAASRRVECVSWSPADAQTAPAEQPTSGADAAYVSLDLLLDGTFGDFVAAALGNGGHADNTAAGLKWVQGCLAGPDMEPFQRLLAAGVTLTRSDVPNASVGETVLAAVMHHFHGWQQRVERQQSRTWHQRLWREINGTTWLIVGFGSLGGEIAKRARPFGVHVIGARRTAVDDPRADEMVTITDTGGAGGGAGQLSQAMVAALGRANVVVIACPLTDETRNLVSTDFLAALASGTTLVNVARGAVVDTAALLEGLDAGQPTHAILDVFEPEPLPTDSPLWAHPSVTMTTHIGGAGSGTIARTDDLFIRQLGAYLRGEALDLVVPA